MLEARYHHHAAGDLDAALDANRQACHQLQTWGAWTTEYQLWSEALSWVSPRSSHAAEIHYELGTLAQRRGEFGTAENHYRAALVIFEEIGDRASIAVSYGQLGNLAYGRSDNYTAEQRYHAALAIFEEIGNRAGIADTYQQLGNLAYDRGDNDTAERCYQNSLAIFEEIGGRIGIARALHQLGMLAQSRDDHDTAEQRYRAALAIEEQEDSKADAASTLSQLGALLADQGRPADAVNYQVQALTIRNELRSPAAAVDVRMLRRQRAALGSQQFQGILRTLMDEERVASIVDITRQSSKRT